MIRFEVDGRLAVISLDRVEARNAINGEMAEAIEGAIDKVEDDQDVWAGILTHEGSVFCAGADLKEIASGNGDRLATRRGGFAGIVLRERTKEYRKLNVLSWPLLEASYAFLESFRQSSPWSWP